MRETDMNFKIEDVDLTSLFAPGDLEPAPALVEIDGMLFEADAEEPKTVEMFGGLFEV